MLVAYFTSEMMPITCNCFSDRIWLSRPLHKCPGSAFVVLFIDARVSFLFCEWVGCMTLVFHRGVETSAVRPVAHRLLTSVWQLHEVMSPCSAIHSRFGVPEIVSFWILDFIHVLVTRSDWLEKNKVISCIICMYTKGEVGWGGAENVT